MKTYLYILFTLLSFVTMFLIFNGYYLWAVVCIVVLVLTMNRIKIL